MLKHSLTCRIMPVLLAVLLCAICVSEGLAEPAAEAAVDLAALKGAAVAELNSLAEVMGKDADTKQDVAGLARLPVLLYVCEAIDDGLLLLSAEISVSEAAAAVPGPTAFVEPYERIGVEALLKAGVMILAGDAIHALAEAAGGTGNAALAAVNARLRELSIDAEYTALSAEGARLSANDLIRLGAALAESETFTAYSNIYMEEIQHENGERTELVNPNRLIRSTTGCFGMATGSSGEAGYCGLFGVRRGETAYLAAVIGAPDSAARFSAAQEMIEYSFTAYKTAALIRAGEVVAEKIPVRGGTVDTVDVIAGGDAVLLLRQSETYSQSVSLPESLSAPLTKDQAVGTLRFTGPGGAVAAEVDLFPAADVPAATLVEYVRRVFISWLHG